MMRYWADSGFCGPDSFLGGPWGGMVNLGFWLLIILLGVSILRAWARPQNIRRPITSSPLDILERRYAAGEIDREEFESCKRDLSD